MTEQNMLDVDAIRLIRERLALADDEKRLAIFEEVTEGYCRDCGRDESKSPMGCQCWNDE